jgi:hypothetical protein
MDEFWRLHENIGADPFDTLAPLGDHAAGQADDHQDQKNLNGDGKNTEESAQRTGGNVAPQQLRLRKASFEGFIHAEKSQRTL